MRRQQHGHPVAGAQPAAVPEQPGAAGRPRAQLLGGQVGALAGGVVEVAEQRLVGRYGDGCVVGHRVHSSLAVSSP
ncbi:hypothetical protein [Micromonospora fulviviridis]|uniref:hypothetical protein n=1 Tax=Micromonospora fulviviridis TaxID=47860 RepID=UPI00227D976D|nr:hypothetical protein [Micromonospora fulviviridis]